MRLALRQANGRTRQVQASARVPEDTFSRRIWLLNEIAQERWGIVLDEMRQTVQTVAAQTRGPLLLAGALLRQAQRAVASGDAQSQANGILDRAARSLAKTDITYERLASSLEAISEPQREGRLAPFSLRSALQDLVNALPRQDEHSLVLDDVPADLPSIRVDSERMVFALRSIVGYLLAIRAPDAQVALRAWTEGERVSFSVTLRSQPARASGEVPAAPFSDGAEQALTAARTIIEGHGGQLSQRATERGLEVHIAALPVSAGSGESAP